MRYLESPSELGPTALRSVFLAGGITRCPDWQQTMRGLLADTDLYLLNPRRANFPIDDPGAAEEQITWEFHNLRRASIILFWFPCETLCPITLFELGAWLTFLKPIFVGVHPLYERRRDVEIQSKLARPCMKVVYSLEELAQQVSQWDEVRWKGSGSVSDSLQRVCANPFVGPRLSAVDL